MWGNHETATHPGQRLSLELIMECVQRTYIYWYDWVPHTDEEFENDIKACLCAEDIMIDYDMFNLIRRLAIQAKGPYIKDVRTGRGGGGYPKSRHSTRGQ